MAKRQNCWEFMNCGRCPEDPYGPDGQYCPTAVTREADGINGGRNGGRICWAIAGTFCSGTVQGDFAAKEHSCLACEFCQLVQNEEDPAAFRVLLPGQNYRPSMRPFRKELDKT